MNSYKIENIQTLSLNKGQFDFFNDKVFLLLLHVDKIPPHLAMLVGGKGYSLTIYGPKVNWELSDILRLVSVKKVKSLFFELDIPDMRNWTWKELNELAVEHTLANSSVDSKKITCLYPLKQFCSDVYSVDCKSVNFIFDLIPKLYDSGAVKNVYQANVELDTKEGDFNLPRYTMEDVLGHIDQQSIKMG